jgi:hypothetical protein
MQMIGDPVTKPDPSIIRLRNERTFIQMAAMLGYTLAAVVNLPLYVLFRWRGWNGLRIYLASGALQGFMIYPVHTLYLDYSLKIKGSYWSWKDALYSIPFLMVCGVAVALGFWLIVRPGRIDRGAELAPAV